jgi:uncharacterized membrane protein YphA (DoxX/SURF4 family)
MDAALAIGRIVLVIIFIFSGLGKFADLSGTAARANGMIHAMKNLSIIGGLIVLAVAGAGRWSYDGRAR